MDKNEKEETYGWLQTLFEEHHCHEGHLDAFGGA